MQAQTQLKPVGVKLSLELKERLQRVGTEKHRSTHWIMKEAIQQYVEREEAAAQFKRETVEAWEIYQRDGLHITQNEMAGWLSTWGTPDETECPPCHK
jgi:predicted transcriptional regulator